MKNPFVKAVLVADEEVSLQTNPDSLPKSMKRTWVITALKLGVGLLWLTGVLLLYRYQSMYSMSLTDTALMLFDFITKTVWGPLLYIMAYTVRPVTFLPGSIFTLFSGIFFGLWGILYTIIGANLSAALSYALARFFGSNVNPNVSWLKRYTQVAKAKPFMTILLMHMLFLPYDAVNYAAGFLKLPFWPYIFGTIIGTLLGITAFVSIGASISIEEFMKNGISTNIIDSRFLLLSSVIFIIAVLISKKITRKLS